MNLIIYLSYQKKSVCTLDDVAEIRIKQTALCEVAQ